MNSHIANVKKVGALKAMRVLFMPSHGLYMVAQHDVILKQFKTKPEATRFMLLFK